MTDDHMNGVGILLVDITELLKNKRLSSKDRVILKSLEYMLKSLPPIREDVGRLKKRSWGLWAYDNPTRAAIIFFAIYSFFISDVIREPVFRWLSENLKILMAAL